MRCPIWVTLDKKRCAHAPGRASIRCTAVSSCRPIRQRELQYCKVERERAKGGGGTALSLRVQVKAGGETHYCSSLQCHSTLHGRNYRTSLKTHARPRRANSEIEGGGGGGRPKSEIRDRQLISHDWTFFSSVFLKLHAFAISFEKRQLHSQPISAARLRIQEQLCEESASSAYMQPCRIIINVRGHFA